MNDAEKIKKQLGLSDKDMAEHGERGDPREKLSDNAGPFEVERSVQEQLGLSDADMQKYGEEDA